MPPPTLVSYADWMKNTAVTFRKRGTELEAVDRALQQYEGSRTEKNLQTLKDKFAAWKQSKGDAWKGGTRDKHQYATLLDQQLSGVGDTDVLHAGQDFMSPALINSRLGVTYLFGNLECDDSIFKVILSGAIDLTTSSLEFAGKGMAEGAGKDAIERARQGVEVGGKGVDFAAERIAERMRAKPAAAKSGGAATVSSGQLAAAAKAPTDSKLKTLYKQITEYLHKLAKQLLDTMRKKIGNFLDDPAGSGLPEALRSLCDLLTSKFLATAAPLIGASLDFAGGVCKTIDASVKTINSWLAGRDVVLLAGHPGTIAQAIQRAMIFSVGEGLYDTLKGGVRLAVEVASAGAAAIASLVASIVEALVKTIWRVVEIERMKRFFAQAKEYWTARNEANAIQKRPIEFNNWFKSYALAIPALAVLALNSGICGDKMHFLQMFKGDNHIVSQSEFDAGCTYVDGLKVWGSEYLEKAGFSFVSEDKVVGGLLKLAKRHTEEASAAGQAWKFALGFLS